MTIYSVVLLLESNGYRLVWLFRDTLVWAAMMVLLVPWRTPGAQEVLHRWIFPGLLATAGLIAICFFPGLDDFLVLGLMLTTPLLATAWTCSNNYTDTSAHRAPTTLP